MNNEVIARIDISTPEGQKIVSELEKKESVRIEYPDSGETEKKTYTHEEVFSELRDKLKEYYKNE